MNTEKQVNQKKRLGIGIGIGALVLIAGAVFAVRLSQPGDSCVAEKVVDIDGNLPLTGDLAVYGDAVQDGSVMALEELKESEPTGSCLNFDWQDNAGDPRAAVSIFQQQYLEPPDIYVSGVRPQTLAIKDQIAAQGTPHFVWIFDVFINKNSKNNFRTWVSFKAEPPLYLAYAKARNAKRVAVVHAILPNIIEAYDQILVPSLKKQGVSQVLVEQFDLGRKDFKDIAVKIKNFKPDFIILQGFQGDMVGLVRSLRPLGLITDGNTIASYDMLDAATILGADELEGIRVIAPVFVTRPEREQVMQWKERFKAKYNREPLYTDAFGYDMVLIIHDAAKRLQLPATSEQWIEALRATNIEGITGSLKFDNNNDLLTPIEIGVFRGGKPIPLSK